MHADAIPHSPPFLHSTAMQKRAHVREKGVMESGNSRQCGVLEETFCFLMRERYAKCGTVSTCRIDEAVMWHTALEMKFYRPVSCKLCT
jgi:hypothetical protein